MQRAKTHHANKYHGMQINTLHLTTQLHVCKLSKLHASFKNKAHYTETKKRNGQRKAHGTSMSLETNIVYYELISEEVKCFHMGS